MTSATLLAVLMAGQKIAADYAGNDESEARIFSPGRESVETTERALNSELEEKSGDEEENRPESPFPLSRCKGTGLAGSIGLRLVDGDAGSGQISREQLPDHAGIIRPSGHYLLNLMPNRLNVHVDKTGVITDVTCG